uniref:Uncharacterized protein n=1 Tax=Brassica oleracea TaxID=3712 RepID=A0A3P6FYY5_BRAOL|nr:unnamed protein product [Brassica oleracea]
MQRSSSGGGSVKKRSSGGGSVKKRSFSGGSLKKRSYGGGSLKKISYGGGSMQRSCFGGASVRKRSSGGGSLLCCNSNAIRSREALTPPRRSDIERPSPELHFVTPSSTKLHRFSLSLSCFVLR